jgi:predicted metal-dependent hydrolase
MTQSSAPTRTVPTRRISFDEALQDVPRHFAADGDLLHSHLGAALSSVFPDGEDFFVRSVRHYRDEITDPDLKRQVAGFIGQEAVHGREHRAFNDRLAALGYPTKTFERMTRRMLTFRERVAPPIANLAATAALEHFTATFAELLLTSNETRELFGHDEVRNLYLWHALEESEHKAVAFDVYKAMGGGERMRTWTMTGLTYAFITVTTLQMAVSLARDADAWRPGRLRASWRRFRRSPIAQPEMWHRLRDYNRPDFHPDDHDTTGLVESWRAALFGSEGALNDKVAAGRAA